MVPSAGGRTTAVCGAFNGARDLVAVHWPRLQHTQNEKLGEAHLDEAIPIRAVGIVHGLSARGLCSRCSLCHAAIICLDGRCIKLVSPTWELSMHSGTSVPCVHTTLTTLGKALYSGARS